MITVRRRIAAQLPRGERVAHLEHLAGEPITAYVPPDVGSGWGCLRNGRGVGPEAWPLVVPADGDELLFFREQRAPALVFVAQVIVAAVIATALAYILNLLLGPKQKKLKPVQVFTGLSNATSRGDTIPTLFGEHRVAPRMIAFYTAVLEDGSNAFHGLYAISLGRIEGIGGETEAFDVRDRDARRVAIGAVTGGPFEVGELVEGSVSGATAVVIRACKDGDDWLYVRQVDGTLEEGDTIEGADSGATAVASDDAEEDPILDAIEINGNPLSSYKGAKVSFRPGEMNQRPIPGWRAVHTVVPIGVTLDNPKDEKGDPAFTTGEWFTHETTQDVDYVVLNFAHPSLNRQGSSGEIKGYRAYYEVRFRVSDTGAGSPGDWWYVQWRSPRYYDLTRTEADAMPVIVSGQHVGPFTSAFRLDFFRRGDRDSYDISVRRRNTTGPDYNTSSEDFDEQDVLSLMPGSVHNPPKKNAQLTLDSIDEVVDEGLAYPGVALLALEAVATDQLNGDPVVSVVAKGVRCPVWDGVDPESPVFAWRWTNNPAWVCLYAALEKRFGVGRRVSVANIDLPSLLAAAEYCDTGVDDGEGGTEALATYDDVIDEPVSFLEFCQRVGSVGRFQPVPVGAKLRFKVEEPRDRVQVFGMGNVIKGTFKRTFLDPTKAPTQVILGIRNRELDYDPDSAISEDDTVDGELRTLRTERRGIVRLGHGRREAKLMRLQGQAITDQIEFEAFLDAMALETGDVFGFAHDIPQWSWSGRLVAGCTTTSLRLDRDVVLEDGVTYEVLVRHQNDERELVEVSSPAGSYAQGEEIEVAAAFSRTPARHSVWMMGPENEVVRDWNCIKIERTGELRSRITAVNWDPAPLTESLSLTDAGTQATVPRRPRQHALAPSVSGVTLVASPAVLPDGSVREGILVSWAAAEEATTQVVEVFVRGLGEERWRSAGRSRTRTHLIQDGLEVGVIYEVAVATVSLSGQVVQDPALASSARITYAPAPPRPRAPVDPYSTRSGDVLVVGWDDPPVDAEDWQPQNRQLRAYEVRRGSDWRSAVRLLSQRGDSVELRDWIATEETYLIAAIDRYGQRSAAAAAIPTHEAPPPGYQVALERDERSTGWGEAKVLATVAGDGTLLLDDGEAIGIYLTNAPIDLGREADWRVAAVAHIVQEPIWWRLDAERVAIGGVTDGPFTAYEAVSAAPSGATGRVLKACSDGDLHLYLAPVSGIFAVDDVITGGTSSATATALSAPYDLTLSDPVWDDRDFGGFATEDVLTESGTGTASGVTLSLEDETRAVSQVTGEQKTVRGRYLSVEATLANDDPDNFRVRLEELRVVVMEPSARVEGLVTGETSTTATLRPDGRGGVVWA